MWILFLRLLQAKAEYFQAQTVQTIIVERDKMGLSWGNEEASV